MEIGIRNAPAIIGLIGSLYFIYHYKYFSRLGHIIGWFIVFTAACEVYGGYLAGLKENNLVILHIYTLSQFVFCTLFFYHLFRLLKWGYLKSWYIYLGIGLIILNTIFIQPIETYNSYSKTGVQFFIIILCFISYYLLTLKDYTYWDKEGVKIFIAAILLSCAISITLYLFSHQIMTLEKATQGNIWNINTGCNILVQVLYIWGLMKIVLIKKRLIVEK